MSIFKQKRQTERKTLIYYLEISDQSSGKLVGRIVDITTDGFQLISEESMDAGRYYQLNVHLPDEINGATSIIVNSRCVRSEKDRHSRYFYSGFQFRETDNMIVAIIEKLMAQYEF